MTHDIVQRPAYAALRCVLKNGESIQAESGSMLAMDATASIDASVQGGLWKAVKRTVLSNESFFVTTIKAAKDETEVWLAPRATGDVEAIELKNQAFIVQGGSFLACTPGVQTDSHFSGWKGFVSGEGVFMIRAEGTGTMFVSSFGGIVEKKLGDDEEFVVDNGHIVAFPADLHYEIRQAGKSLFSMVTTGEGLVSVFKGPGTIYLQTRNLRTFAETLNPFLRAPQSSQGKGLLGNVFGG